MKNTPCISVIKNKYMFLTNVEKKVADYVLCNSDEIMQISVARLAKKAGVAPSAVMRFCHSVGFDGYSDFKLSLSIEISKKDVLAFEPEISRYDDISTISGKIFKAGIKTLEDTMNMLDTDMLSVAADVIAKASSIYIWGIGTSAPIANDAAYRIMQLGYSVFYSPDPITMRIATSNMNKNDVAIVISHSGRTRQILDFLKLARENSAKTIAITSFSSSPAYRMADIPMSIYSDEIRYPMEAIASRIAHICVIDAVTVALSVKQTSKSEIRMNKSRELIENVRTGFKQNYEV